MSQIGVHPRISRRHPEVSEADVMAAMRSMRKGSVLGMAAEPITTNWSIFATAGRR